MEENKITPIEIQKYLKGVNYPASKEDLLEAAKNNDAGQEVFEVLDNLPEKEFETPADVSKEIGD